MGLVISETGEPSDYFSKYTEGILWQKCWR